MRATPLEPGFGPSLSNQPRSPCVAHTRDVSTPSDEYRANVDPNPSVSSSGCGNTANNFKVPFIAAPIPIKFGSSNLHYNLFRDAFEQIGFQLSSTIDQAERAVERSLHGQDSSRRI